MNITKGNWKVGTHKSTVVTDDLSTADFVSRDSKDSIEYYGGALIAESCRKDDAILIAAAPEMLEALREISNGAGRYNEDRLIHASNTIDDMKQLALDAIKKATNE